MPGPLAAESQPNSYSVNQAETQRLQAAPGSHNKAEALISNVVDRKPELAGVVKHPREDVSALSGQLHENSKQSGLSETPTKVAAHSQEFRGTTEQAQKLCPYLGSRSLEEADRAIQKQAEEKAELDSIMDLFESTQSTAEPRISKQEPKIGANSREAAVTRVHDVKADVMNEAAHSDSGPSIEVSEVQIEPESMQSAKIEQIALRAEQLTDLPAIADAIKAVAETSLLAIEHEDAVAAVVQTKVATELVPRVEPEHTALPAPQSVEVEFYNQDIVPSQPEPLPEPLKVTSTEICPDLTEGDAVGFTLTAVDRTEVSAKATVAIDIGLEPLEAVTAAWHEFADDQDDSEGMIAKTQNEEVSLDTAVEEPNDAYSYDEDIDYFIAEEDTTTEDTALDRTVDTEHTAALQEAFIDVGEDFDSGAAVDAAIRQFVAQQEISTIAEATETPDEQDVVAIERALNDVANDEVNNGEPTIRDVLWQAAKALKISTDPKKAATFIKLLEANDLSAILDLLLAEPEPSSEYLSKRLGTSEFVSKIQQALAGMQTAAARAYVVGKSTLRLYRSQFET